MKITIEGDDTVVDDDNCVWFINLGELLRGEEIMTKLATLIILLS